MNKVKIVLSLLFFLVFIFTYSQNKNIKILERKNIEYYFVYKTYENKTKDTIIMLSSRNDKEFERIKLNVGKCYETKTRLKSAIKISEDEYLFCRPNVTTINGIKVSNENMLPILILSYKEL